MAVALRHRANEKRAGLWPAVWVVTTDRRMGPAYARLSRTAAVPLCITSAQWSTLVTRCCDAPSIEQLSSTSAPLLVQDAAMAIAARYPEVALEFARTLSQAGTGVADVRTAQMSLDDVLSPDGADPRETGIRLAGDLLARRASRMTAAHEARSTRDGVERDAAQTVASQAVLIAERERQIRRSSDRRAEKAEGKLSETEMAIRDAARLGTRKAVVAVLLTLGVVAAVLLLVNKLFVVGGATALSCTVLVKQGMEWTTDPKARARKMLAAGLVEILGLLQLVWSPGK